eukprot:1655061-Pyramimonas_sp.AAC.1
MLQKLGLAPEALDGPVITGGDWNMSPAELEASQFSAHVFCSSACATDVTFRRRWQLIISSSTRRPRGRAPDSAAMP